MTQAEQITMHLMNAERVKEIWNVYSLHRRGAVTEGEFNAMLVACEELRRIQPLFEALTRERDALAAHCHGLASDITKISELLSEACHTMTNDDSIRASFAVISKSRTRTPAASLDAVIGPTVEAMQTFCRRVESGEVRSVKSYAMFMAELTRLQKLLQNH